MTVVIEGTSEGVLEVGLAILEMTADRADITRVEIGGQPTKMTFNDDYHEITRMLDEGCPNGWAQ